MKSSAPSAPAAWAKSAIRIATKELVQLAIASCEVENRLAVSSSHANLSSPPEKLLGSRGVPFPDGEVERRQIRRIDGIDGCVPRQEELHGPQRPARRRGVQDRAA
jgi:hypothetical protein